MNVYGRNTVIEALRSSFHCKKVFIREDTRRDEKISFILELARSKNIEIEFVSASTLTKLTKTKEHQNVACAVDYNTDQLSTRVLANLDKSCIYISEAFDPNNIGAIIRTAECAGFDAIIIPNDIDITPTIAKVSSGALFHINVYRSNIFQAIKLFKQNAFDIVAIERGGEKLYNSELKNNSLFIIGGENKSVSESVRKDCDKIVEIPQYGKINSLNMSVATAIVIYEHLRQINLNNQ